MQYRIGDRDPVTGLYDVIHPDGSATRNGIKIFNSAHEFGDVVLATQRSDGMMILDGVKAALTESVPNSFTLGKFGDKPVGYLNGQVFNNEEEVILPVVLIEFAPGSPTELEPNTGDFVLRIKIDRPQRKDLRVKCELAGTAGSGDYTYTGLDGDLFAVIPAGELFFDVVISPINNQSGVNQTVVTEIIKLRDYRIGQDNVVTTTIRSSAPVLSIFQLNNSFQEISKAVFLIRFELTSPIASSIFIQSDITGTLSPNNFSLTGGILSGNILTVELVAGTTFTDIEIVPINRRILTAEGFYITIDQSSVPALISTSSNSAVFIAALPSPVRVRVKYFPRIVENPVLNSSTAIYSEIRSQPDPLLSPTFYMSSTDYTDLVLTITGALIGETTNMSYEFNPDLTLIQGLYRLQLRDFILSQQLASITPFNSVSLYGEYLDFDALGLANFAVSQGSRYVYICGKNHTPLIPPNYHSQSYATVSCELSDTATSFNLVNQSLDQRFSTKYETLAGEVVSERVGYVDLISLGLLNAPIFGLQFAFTRTVTGWVLKIDTNDMSVSFVNPVIEVNAPSRPNAFISDQNVQIVSI